MIYGIIIWSQVKTGLQSKLKHNTFGNINVTEGLKHFKIMGLTWDPSWSNQTDSNLFKYGWTQNKTKILNINVWTIAGSKELKDESNKNKGNQN